MDAGGLLPVHGVVGRLLAREAVRRAVAVGDLHVPVRAATGDLVRLVRVDVDRVAEPGQARDREREVVADRRLALLLERVVGEVDHGREAAPGRFERRPAHEELPVRDVGEVLHPGAELLAVVVVVLLEAEAGRAAPCSRSPGSPAARCPGRRTGAASTSRRGRAGAGTAPCRRRPAARAPRRRRAPAWRRSARGRRRARPRRRRSCRRRASPSAAGRRCRSRSTSRCCGWSRSRPCRACPASPPPGRRPPPAGRAST